MFTGLIQSLGSLQHLSNNQLYIQSILGNSDVLYKDIALGDSIAIDGICLTVEHILNDGFIVSVSPETLQKTTLGQLSDGTLVNLEPSLRVGSKIGGHFVTGHVDGLGSLENAIKTDNAWELRFQVKNSNVCRYIVPKGSVAVNGISLTIANCSSAGDWFTVAVIPVTYGDTNLKYLSPGQTVNLEGDILGKYVERFVAGKSRPQDSQSKNLSLAFLLENGYGQ